MISFEKRLLLGVANVAADNTEAEVLLWSELDAEGEPNPDQPDDSVGIFMDIAPEEIDAVTITDYIVDDDPAASDSVIGVQVRISATSRDKVKAIASDLFALFHGRWGGMLGTVTLVSARRTSGTNTGQDSSGRVSRVDNYYMTVHRPSTHRQ